MNKRYLFFILSFSLFLFNLTDVKALQNWTYDVPNSGKVYYYATTYQLAYSNPNIDYDKMTIGGANELVNLDYLKATTSSDIYVFEYIPGLIQNHTYYYQLWYCFNTSTASSPGLLLVNNATNNQSNRSFNYYGKVSLDDNDYLTASGTQYTHYSCNMAYYSFNYTGENSSEGSYLIARIGGMPTSSKRMVFYGTKLTDMGITDSVITKRLDSINQSIVNSQNSQTTMKEDIIKNQNSNAQEIQENQDKNTDKLLNADSESSFKGDGGATSNYNQAEEDLMESIDVNVDDLDLDFSPFLKPFSWIWEQVDKLLNLNSKLFSTVITVLTFGFIGLVINRG